MYTIAFEELNLRKKYFATIYKHTKIHNGYCYFIGKQTHMPERRRARTYAHTHTHTQDDF